MSRRTGNRAEENSPIGFTAILCGTCDEGEPADLAVLRQTVRRTPHAMLVRAHCPLGQMWCQARSTPANAGRTLLVQPCTTGRVPVGSAILISPVRTVADLATVARWLETTPVDADALPPHLRQIQRPRHQSNRN